MFKKILIPLDGSERAEQILAHLGALLKAVDCEILLLGVIDNEGIYGAANLLKPTAQATKRAVEYLDGVVDHLRDCGLQADYLIRDGRAHQVILEVARDSAADLISIASHGHSGLDRLFFGSTAERVLRHSDVPVLLFKSHRTLGRVLPSTEPPAVTPLALENILVPLDGSPHAEIAMNDALELAQIDGATLHLVHVTSRRRTSMFFPPLEAFEAAPDAQLDYLESTAERLRRSGADVRAAIMRGTPVEGLSAYLADTPIDLMVMTTHGRSGLTRMLLGSVAESILRHVHVPILLRRTQVRDD